MTSRAVHSSTFRRVVVAGGRRYVLEDRDRYERLLAILEETELTELRDSPDDQWVDFDDYRRELAGSRIAQARKARRWTQTQLAERLGVPQSQISRIERNPTQTTIRTLRRIAKALDLDVRDLLD